MNDQQLLRYSRQIMLPGIDTEGQRKLLDSSVLVVGLGGLGAPLAMYLAAAGVGHLILADHDNVDLSNLQRQIIHDSNDIEKPKVESAAETLLALNPEIHITPIPRILADDELIQQVTAADVVVDCTDNFASRFAINGSCVENQTPLVSGAAIRYEGQISVYPNDGSDSPCYRCLYADQGEELDETCTANGVLAPVPGIIGSAQAIEVLKLITGIGRPLTGRLLLFDALSMEWRTIGLKKDPNCPVCGGNQATFHGRHG